MEENACEACGQLPELGGFNIPCLYSGDKRVLLCRACEYKTRDKTNRGL